MIDLNSAKDIENKIKAADNKQLWALCKHIKEEFSKAQVLIGAAKALDDKPAVDKRLTADATDAEIRHAAKLVLIGKLDDKTITAAEFAQFKDVFGLASQTDNLVIQCVDFKSMCIDCPKLSAPEVV